LAAACAGIHAALAAEPGAVIDVSIEEALATMAIGELANAGLGGKSRARKRLTDGNGATVSILPARDGFAAISPREDRQWAAWLSVMGSPDWGGEARFATKPDRVANWDELFVLMSAWSRQHDKQWIADQAQAAHVPSFPLREPAEQLCSPQLAHRRFYRSLTIRERTIKAPGPPFGLAPGDCAHRVPRQGKGLGLSGQMPLSGVRILDFSWVIAGPTATRYLAAMGAEVIKIEMPGRGDPARSSELHTVLGQAKRGMVLDLKQPRAVAIARALASKSDVLIENFATGVMDRLGLGVDAVREVNSDSVYVSASGLGRTGPEAHAVAYGTLLQCYAGFAGLNRHPDMPPRVGFAWLDPMCGLMLAFTVAAGLRQIRRTGVATRVDFSMIEALLWTMADPLLASQLGAPPQGDHSTRDVPHGAYRCEGEDNWIAIAVTDDREWRSLCAVVPGLSPMSGLEPRQRMERRASIDETLAIWLRPKAAAATAADLARAGVPAAALANSVDLVNSEHLKQRGFWDRHGAGVLPGLPWHASFGRTSGLAPQLGADTDAILAEVLNFSADEIAGLRRSGAVG
jgi:crotonobetainyl-CoA:carnitine CoA-transferase CaiB-like acyl-CoA transferase